jgi:hypothetical protein
MSERTSSGASCRDCRGHSYGRALCDRCVVKRLEERSGSLVKELFPNGVYKNRGRECRIGSLSGEAGESLCIAIGGKNNGRWKDWSTDEKGNLLGLIAAVECQGDRIEALHWGLRWLGEPERQRPARPLPVHEPEAESENYKRAVRLWRKAVPLQRGDPVWQYLGGRGIDLERWAQANNGKLPACLRFHPCVWNGESGRSWPAMLAAVVGPDTRFCAVHRTWLAEVNGRVGQAPLSEKKMTLASYKGEGGNGCIRLWRPNWDQATGEDKFAISEGIEDAMTTLQFATDPLHLRVAAGVSLSALKETWVPKIFDRIVLIADNDQEPGPVKLFEKVCERFKREGREVEILRAWQGVKDINEQVTKFGLRPKPLTPAMMHDANGTADYEQNQHRG